MLILLRCLFCLREGGALRSLGIDLLVVSFIHKENKSNSVIFSSSVSSKIKASVLKSCIEYLIVILSCQVHLLHHLVDHLEVLCPALLHILWILWWSNYHLHLQCLYINDVQCRGGNSALPKLFEKCRHHCDHTNTYSWSPWVWWGGSASLCTTTHTEYWCSAQKRIYCSPYSFILRRSCTEVLIEMHFQCGILK